MKAIKIISTYYGNRRNMNNNLLTGDACLEFLQLQIENELNVNPGCEMDILIVNNNTGNIKFNSYLDSLNGNSICNGKILILHRENIGGSFGAFSDGYELVQDQYQYFLFNEDDIMITEPHYFKTAIDELDSDELCGFIALSPISTTNPVHCGGGFGVTSKTILDIIRNQHGKLPYAVGNTYGHFEYSEVMFTNNIIKLGYTIKNVQEWSPLAENYTKHTSQNKNIYVTEENLNKKFIYKVGK